MQEIKLVYVDGIEIYPKEELQIAIKIDDTNQCVTITPIISKHLPLVHLKYDQIIDCSIEHDEMITKKNKSVVGRAIVGGILTGGIGAVVGGMSGIGSKKTVKKTHYLVIKYKSKDNEIKVLSLKMTWLVNLAEFTKAVNKRINQNKSYDMTETYL